MLLLTAPPGVIAWVVLAFTTIPVGDAFLVLHSGGDARAAWSIHVPTAALMLVGAACRTVG